MSLSLHPYARVEIDEAMDKYASVSGHLAWRFVEEIELVLEEIEQMPERWAYYEPLAEARRWRRRRMAGFPYLIIYESIKTGVLVVAAPHVSRQPGYWQDRE